jgi:general secretion pathway protein G
MDVKLAEIRARRGEAGYTLIELLVVLAILGFLAAIATVQVIHYLDSAKISTAKTEVSNIAAGLDLYKLDVGGYPTTQQGLESLVKAPDGAQNWNGPYIKKTTNLNDPWGHPYNYRSPGQYGEFDIYSFGPKGDEGNTGAKPLIANW